MPQHRLFDVSPQHIAALDDEGLRLLIARLCEADLRRRGLSTSAVLYGGNQIAADGGIDVRSGKERKRGQENGKGARLN